MLVVVEYNLQVNEGHPQFNLLEVMVGILEVRYTDVRSDGEN